MAGSGTEVKKLITIVSLGSVLVLGTAVSCDIKPTEYYPVELPDCDADDRTGKWDTADCGPSPKPVKTPGTRNTPAPRKTR